MYRPNPIALLLVIPALAACEQGGTPEETPESLTRLATLPLGAEATGLFATEAGDLFFNVQHPDDTNQPPFDRAAVGALTGVDIHALPDDTADVGVPRTAEERTRVRVAAGRYQVLANGGETVEGTVEEGLGTVLGADGEPLTRTARPDFNGFVPTDADGDRGYLYTNWESRPGGMSRLELAREGDQWTVERGENLDFRAVGGTMTNCFGTVSPWNTPLSSEEQYIDDTADWNDPGFEDADRVDNMAAYLGHFPNPYRYGYIVEIAEPTGQARPEKRYAMGRFSHENSVVMPDEKTVYLTDDGSGAGFFKFIADEAGDLTAGTLYAARAHQDEGRDPAEVGFDLEWVELGHATEEEVAGWIAEYDDIDRSDYRAGRSSYIDETEIRSWARGDAEDDRVAFLESRRAARVAGATAEFRKMEGINIHPAGAESGEVPYMYAAMSYLNETMADHRGDIRLRPNECGVVYRMRLEEGYDVARMEPVLAGGPHEADARDYSCSAYNVANPDNIVVLRDGRVVIGEDSSHHRNNMVWVFDPER
jgi:secreted PhoX family phosphatase